MNMFRPIAERLAPEVMKAAQDIIANAEKVEMVRGWGPYGCCESRYTFKRGEDTLTYERSTEENGENASQKLTLNEEMLQGVAVVAALRDQMAARVQNVMEQKAEGMLAALRHDVCAPLSEVLNERPVITAGIEHDPSAIPDGWVLNRNGGNATVCGRIRCRCQLPLRQAPQVNRLYDLDNGPSDCASQIRHVTRQSAGVCLRRRQIRCG